jgi:L-lactate utilization protein LutB
MLIEECSELIKSVTKLSRISRNQEEYNIKVKNFEEELADAQLMIDEFIYYFELGDRVKEVRKKKLKRLEELFKE